MFAALYGTVATSRKSFELSHRRICDRPEPRGDPALLSPGVEELEHRTGVRCFGVLPYLAGLGLDAEDSLGLAAAVRGPVALRPAPSTSLSLPCHILRTSRISTHLPSNLMSASVS